MIVRSNAISAYDSEEYKAKLLRELREYRGIIVNSLYDCLNSLLGLEISALSKEIDDKKKSALTKFDFDLYRQISIYNIMCRIQKLFIEDNDKLKIYKDSWFNNLDICIVGQRINADDYDEDPYLHLFQFNFKPKPDKLVIQLSSRTRTNVLEKVKVSSTIIGDINLHEYVEFKGQNKKNVEAYQRELEKTQKKSYGTFIGETEDISDPALFGHPGHFYTCNNDLMELKLHREEEIAKYLNIIQYYHNKKGLTDTEKLAIEMSQKYHDLLLQELGSNIDEFKPVTTYSDAKVLKLTRPNYNIKNTIHYVE